MPKLGAPGDTTRDTDSDPATPSTDPAAHLSTPPDGTPLTDSAPQDIATASEEISAVHRDQTVIDIPAPPPAPMPHESTETLAGPDPAVYENTGYGGAAAFGALPGISEVPESPAKSDALASWEELDAQAESAAEPVDAWASYDEREDGWVPLTGDSSGSTSGLRDSSGAAFDRAITDHGVNTQGRAAPAVAARLVSLASDDMGREVILADRESSIGRDPNSTIVLSHTSASRQHAQIFRDEDRYLVVDQRSANGTFVNGERIDRARLQSGDEVAFGSSAFRFLETGDVFKPSDVAAQPLVLGDAAAPAPAAAAVAAASQPAPTPSWRLALLVGILMIVGVSVASLYVRLRGGIGSTAARRTLIFEHYVRGTDSFKGHQWDDAENEFNAILALDPGHVRGREYIAAIAEEKAAHTKIEQARDARRTGDLLHAYQLASSATNTEFRNDAHQVLREVDAELDARMGRAQAALEAGRTAEALRILADVQRVHPGRQDVATLLQRANQISNPAVDAAAAAAPPAIVAASPRRSGAERGGRPDAGLRDAGPRNDRPAGPARDAVQALIDGNVESAVSALTNGTGSDVDTLRTQLEALRDVYAQGVQEYRSKRAAPAIRDLLTARAAVLKISGGGALVDDLDRKIADMYYVLGIQDYLNQQLSTAYQEFAEALKASPQHVQAQRKIAEITAKAQDLYNEGYALRDRDGSTARSRFQLVMQMVPADHELYRKAKQRLDALP